MRTDPRYDARDVKVKKEEYGGKEFDITYIKAIEPMSKEEIEAKIASGEIKDTLTGYKFCCPPLQTGKVEEMNPYIVRHCDVPCKMRDGVTIYADIYLPKRLDEQIPVILSWSPYGKRQAEAASNWKLMGVPPQTVTKMAKFESADPGYWCRHGYAVANVDPRGVGNSEGDIDNFGVQDGQDGYDFIEWIAEQEWCNGKVATFGNSAVAMTQWMIAAEQPPHLACIAPWEGTGDLYRESLCFGGIPSPRFNSNISYGLSGHGYVEYLPAVLEDNPYINEYWEAKIPKWEKIRIPAYVCAGWCHFHLRGSFEGYRRIRSTKKWFRCHRDFEWPDTYSPGNLEDLKRFYDRYLKEINNGWELTPKVRVEVMDAYDCDYASNRPEAGMPIPRTEYKKLYLDAANRKAGFEPYSKASEVEYDPQKGEIAVFEHTFEEDTEITGYMKLHLNIECRGHDNMDIVAWVKKLDTKGNYLPIHCLEAEYRGAWGYFRAKRRELDPKWSSDFQPVQAHRKDEPMEQGQIYAVDVEMWPHSRIWHKGETLRLELHSDFVVSSWFMDPNLSFETDNGEGKHVIHTGGEYDSYLQIPVIPPKHKSGDYVYKG